MTEADQLQKMLNFFIHYKTIKIISVVHDLLNCSDNKSLRNFSQVSNPLQTNKTDFQKKDEKPIDQDNQFLLKENSTS